MSADDMSELPDRVRASAILDGGEVLWPFDIAPEAITELGRLDRVVLGVDARERNDRGLVTEVPVSIYELTGRPGDVERGCQRALEAVARAEAITGWRRPLILVTWQPLAGRQGQPTR